MKKAMRLKQVAAVATLATAGVLAAGVTATPAAAAEAPAPAQLICGYYEQGGVAYYGHCDLPPRTDITITVRQIWPFGNYNLCVKPGVTTLGVADLITGASFNGNLCWAG